MDESGSSAAEADDETQRLKPFQPGQAARFHPLSSYLPRKIDRLYPSESGIPVTGSSPDAVSGSSLFTSRFATPLLRPSQEHQAGEYPPDLLGIFVSGRPNK